MPATRRYVRRYVASGGASAAALAAKLDKTGGTLTGSVEINADIAGYLLYLINANTGGAISVEVGNTFQGIFSSQVTGDVDSRLYIAGDGSLNWGSGAGNQDVNLSRTAAGVLGTDGAWRVKAVATGSRPSAASVGAGAMIYDTTLGIPIWSNGSAWRDAAGNAV